MFKGLPCGTFFRPPRARFSELVSKIQVYPNDKVIEPSAGDGDLADVIYDVHGVRPKCIETEKVLVDCLRAKGYHGWQMNFLKYRQPADVFIANPPFGSYFQDIDHFRHAYSLLKPGGRIAFILHEYSGFPLRKSGKLYEFVQWLE